MIKLEEMNLSSEVTKQRVKAAKQAIPYVFKETDDNVPKLNQKQLEFVNRKIEERTSLRSNKRYKEADEIGKGLTAMGIVIDDALRTWTIGDKPTVEEEPTIEEDASTGIACMFCSRHFASKNLVFKHLRDVSTSCGNAIFQTGEKVPDAPSHIRKAEKRQIYLSERARKRNTGKATIHEQPDATLWFGDIPLPYTRPAGQYKRLRAVLREYLPRNVPQPRIKKVVRKGYRQGIVDDNQLEKDPYLGFALIVFRDAEEASLVEAESQGKTVTASNVFKDSDCSEFPSFQIKIRQIESEKEESSGNKEDIESTNTEGNIDPSIRDQLSPLSFSELQERYRALKTDLGCNNSSCIDEREITHKDHRLLLDRIVDLYQQSGERTEVNWEGKPVDEEICNELLTILQNLRWPAESHRKGLSSERYLVLQTNVNSDRFYNDLRCACRKLMEKVDPDYYYSGIAVTKNFVASPHIDDKDKSFQYAISLGNFENGGQLCVEGTRYNEKGIKSTYVNVVDTHNRIARADGRCVHWVRKYEKGDRYSLIFYDTTDQHKVKLNEAGVDSNFAIKK